MSLIPAPVVWQKDNAPSHHSNATFSSTAIARAFAVVAAFDAPGKAVSAFKNRLQ